MMSTDDIGTEAVCCASCGIAEVDDIKLKNCDDCDLVRYCSDKCQEDHRPDHEAMCKERAAELRDELLFRQPENSHLGDCPICCLPRSLDAKKSVTYFCCSKLVCKGCAYAAGKSAREESRERNCPFCRQPGPRTAEGEAMYITKRVAANDPLALSNTGTMHFHKGNHESAIEYWARAAELGHVAAHYELSLMYQRGDGVEKDKEKELYHLEEAAIGGHPDARFNLGCYEAGFDRAVKHFIIAAKLGHDDSIRLLKMLYADGKASKKDFAAALRAHQAAVDGMKSPQREEAEKLLA